MKCDVSKLKPVTVGVASKEAKWVSDDLSVGDTVWVVKNIAGKYTKPYEVLVSSDVSSTWDGSYVYGFLALVETEVDSYYTSITNMDILGLSEEDVLSKVKKLLKKQKKHVKARKTSIVLRKI